jgi:hypothetical protein
MIAVGFSINNRILPLAYPLGDEKINYNLKWFLN